MLETGADIGIAFDGDADRMLAVDEKGNMIDGDQIMAIVGNHMKKKGCLKQDTIVATVMSNLGFMLMAREHDIEIKQTKDIEEILNKEISKDMLEKEIFPVIQGDISFCYLILHLSQNKDFLNKTQSLCHRGEAPNRQNIRASVPPDLCRISH